MTTIDINAQFGAYPARHKPTTFEQVVSGAADAGVSQSVACSTTGIFYNDREGNLEAVNAAAAQPQRLLAAATLNPATTLDPARTVAEIAAGPFRMVRFFPVEQGWPLDFAPFRQCVRLLTERNLPIMVSCARHGDSTQVARIVAEAGGASTVLEGVEASSLAEALAAMRDCASLLIETHALISAEALPAIRDALGADRIVFGSGAAALSLPAALGFVQGSNLTDAEKAQVLGGNAARVLKL